MEYFNVFEYLIRTLHEIKKVGGILTEPAPKKGKAITNETLNLVTNVYEDDGFSKQVPEKKVDVSVSKGVHKQNLGNFMEERLWSHKHDFSISAE